MEKFLRFVSGYVLLLIEGEQAERFLNLCRARKIRLRGLKRRDECSVTVLLSVRDFFMLRPLRKKTGVRLRIMEKHGLPFFFYRNRKRKAFFLGILLGFCIMVLLSTHIWNIHVTGNIKNSTPEILLFLEQQGIRHGIAKSKVNCSEIAAMVRKQYPEITWVSARMEGTRLILTVQEGKMAQAKAGGADTPCNISADVEGVIVKMITRKGLPLFKPGDTCKKGDVLVLGRLDIMNDSQEPVRYEYVHADADIYVSRDISYYHEFSMDYETTIPTGEERKSFYLKVGNLFFDASGKRRENWRRVTQEIPWRITENFYLPVRLGKIRETACKNIHATYTDAQAKKLARKHLHLFEEKLIQKGVQISENNVKIEIDGTVCVSRGTLKVIEKTGKETSVETLEQPQERTAEDG